MPTSQPKDQAKDRSDWVDSDWADEVTVEGKVVPGHGVASGQGENTPYPASTIEMQSPHFLAQGVDLYPFYPGTLNVSIAPHRFELAPRKTLHQVKWSPHHTAETFSFTPIRLIWQAQSYSGLVYYPHPETKIDHFQDPAVLELLMPVIVGITTGSSVVLAASASELIIKS